MSTTPLSFAGRALQAIAPDRYRRFAPRPVAVGGPTMLELCRRALAAPVGAPPLAALARDARRIAIVISDASRDEPREDMLRALLEIVPAERITLVVASGTHRGDASVVPAPFKSLPCVVHDAARLDRCADLGTTREGTRVRVASDVADADLVIVTGRIRPHYFAGWSGGVKGVFPGCGYRDDVLANHQLKADPSARPGRVADNRCRLDMEDAAQRVPGRLFMLDVLCDCDGSPVAALAGDVVIAHRELCARARELFLVRAPRAPVVVVADQPPVTRSLYQASKLLPPAGPLLEDGGTLIVVAECDLGTGDLSRVNDGIYRLGVAHQLPPHHDIVLVSTLPPDTVAKTYTRAAPDLGAALDAALGAAHADHAVLLWRAGEMITEVTPVAPS